MSRVELPINYVPLDEEEYMSSYQLEYFRQRLISWKNSLYSESRGTLEHFKSENWKEPDFNDRASIEAEAALELRTRDRERKLLDKIDEALMRIETKEYGYCEATGEPIGLKRLQARPVATLCIEAQEQHEDYEKHHSDELDLEE